MQVGVSTWYPLNQGAPVFAPTDIPNLAGWWDASDTSTIMQTGGSVSQWNDKSGNGYNATQSNGSNQPVTGTNTINGKNCLKFDGSNDVLNIPSALYGLSNGDSTMFIATQAAVSTANAWMLNGKDASTSNYGVLYAGGSNNFIYYAGANAFTNGISTRPDLNPHVYAMSKASSVFAGIQDGFENFKTQTTNFTMTGFGIGGAAPNYFNGSIGEVVLYNRALTVAEKNQVGNYLASKWGSTWENISNLNIKTVSVNNLVPGGHQSSGTNTHQAFYFPWTVGQNTTALVANFNNWYSTNTGSTRNGNPLRIESCAFVSPGGTVYPVTFNGANSYDMPDGRTDKNSDPVPATANIGEVWYVKGVVSVSAAGQFWPLTNEKAPGTIQNNSQAVMYLPSATTISSTYAAGQFTATGTALTNLGVSFCPIILGIPTGNDPCYFVVGDSISVGVAAQTVGNLNGRGFIYRALEMSPAKAGINFSAGGITAQTTNIISQWKSFLKYANRGVTELITNDIGTTNTTPLATLQARIEETWNILKTNGVSKIAHSKLMCRTSSASGQWTSNADQTILTGWNPGENAPMFNTYIDTKVLDSTINIAVNMNAVRDPIDPMKWITNGANKYLNDDDVHPNTAGHAIMAVDLRAQLDAMA